jgi:hypothetical protein
MEKFLSERYSHRYEWVFLTQVRNSTGSADRIADAMAFNMYQSTGYEILGFEIKVSRSDWLSELKHMSKSNDILEYCDKWFLVVPDANIVKDGELPKNWGLLVLKGDKLVVKVRPTLMPVKPMPDHFIASILRRSSNEVERIRSQYILKESIQDEIQKAEQRGYERGQGYNGQQAERRFKELEEKVDLFEKATGVELIRWRGKDYVKTIGAYVKMALEIDSHSLNSSISNIESAIKTLTKASAEIKQIKKEITGL